MADSSHRATGKQSFCRGIPVQITVTEMLRLVYTGNGWMEMSGPGSTSRNGTKRPRKSVKYRTSVFEAQQLRCLAAFP